MAAHHIAQSVREDIPPALRAAHACAAIVLSVNGHSTHADGWHFTVDRSLLDYTVRKAAFHLAMQHAHDARAAVACGSVTGLSDMTLILALWMAITVVVCASLVARPRRKHCTVKRTRAEDLAVIASLPEETPPAHGAVVMPQKRTMRRSDRGLRPPRTCGCCGVAYSR